MIALPEGAALADYQRYIHELEALHGWLDNDLVHNCFLMGEEMGELFKAVRRQLRYYDENAASTAQDDAESAARKAHVAEELVDVLNYLLAIANRLEIDMEAAFKAKNALNQQRSWQK
ncbi:MAG: hypothetical protein IGS03_02325 [Candidatus Sericytochromatia bacterium]|nr:hypothetical protein [Candidatus Sericytochromatia bacterium]